MRPAGLLVVVAGVVGSPDQIMLAEAHVVGVGKVQHQIDVAHVGHVARELVGPPLAVVLRREGIEPVVGERLLILGGVGTGTGTAARA